MAWQDLSKYRLKAAMHEEAHEGWLWIDGPWTSGDPLILRYRKARKVHLVCRKIDYNFRGYYDAEMRNRYRKKAKPLDEKTSYLLLAKHYRDLLGIDADIKDWQGILVPGLEVKQARGLGKAWSRLRASLMHSDPYVRIGTWLALVGLLVAFVALVPVFIAFPQWNPWGG